MNKVLLIYTGGTIGMGKNSYTGALEPLDFNHLVDSMPEFQLIKTDIDIYQFAPPIDSSDMAPENGFTSAAVAGAMVASHFSATVSSAGGTSRFFGVTRITRPSMPFWVRSARRAADRVVSEITAPVVARLP